MTKISRLLALLFILCICVSFPGCVSKKAASSAEESQVSGMEEIPQNKANLSKIEGMVAQYPSPSAYRTVAVFEASLSKNGEIQDYNLSFYGFDKEKNYDGIYTFKYNAKTKEVTYTVPDKSATSKYKIEYNENAEWSHISSELKRLPLEKQIAKLNFPRYKISINSGTQLKKGTPIIDGSNGQNFAVLSFADYKKGKGGTSDGHTAVIARLYDDMSASGENTIYYRCKAANQGVLYGNRNFTMKQDYYLNKNSISFTRDYGETWIKADVSANDISETLNIYKSQNEIPYGSYYVSEKQDGIIAFFYGGKPTLSISKDNGKTWQKSLFKFNYADIQKAITHRIIGFTSNTEGYVGLGTDWTMGTGEAKFCYMTHDGGATWKQKKLPLSGTPQLLGGMAFSDDKNGVVSYNKANSIDEIVPTLYFTNNGGDSWTEFKIQLNSIKDGSLSKVESLVFENGTYTLTFSQNSSGSRKVSFKSTNLKNWTFQKAWTAVVHTVG